MNFPCDFPLKIIGNNSESFTSEMVHIVTKYFPEFATDTCVINKSKDHKYVSITVVVNAQDQATLDALYLELTQHPDTKMVL